MKPEIRDGESVYDSKLFIISNFVSSDETSGRFNYDIS